MKKCLLRSFAAAAQARFASTLILAEHNNVVLNSATLSAVMAASKIGGDIDMLVGGASCGAVAEQAAKLPGIRKVFCADSAVFGKPVAEDIEKLILQIHDAHKYSHILAPASASAKATLPRVAAKLDVNQLSDVLSIEAEDTFVRPIYAGNALATVKSADAVKVLTIRPTAFEKVLVCVCLKRSWFLSDYPSIASGDIYTYLSLYMSSLAFCASSPLCFM
eukprot:CAMPEP_0173074160 /NCGR_PEP_ID=MMETSP1102-20130122/10843_1 /TAXON_ID=49646 /ORGANISM="Geminigera sp., Strain Caron Lab Isolate" /LENGTH=219 /DNA_ID=CAMNT_0013943159 /DNA_START=30 /DNA_END=689 /DNA_ORIENTATION=+